MKKARVIFLLIIIISLIVAMMFKVPYESGIKLYMIMRLLLISTIDRRVFGRQKEKHKKITAF